MQEGNINELNNPRGRRGSGSDWRTGDHIPEGTGTAPAGQPTRSYQTCLLRQKKKEKEEKREGKEKKDEKFKVFVILLCRSNKTCS